ncbi:acyl-CoA dehydrogenase family protein [Streptomyces antibioticus]|uniref:acyl-CoA dehydrogenase family protein n=1 Tax=Streptomyces antibioticus TaxID=1890 RepID=UPI0036BFD8FE
MRFQLSDDQLALRAGVRELLARRFDREALRAAVGRPGLDRALWRELGAAGFFALRLPEARGGVGLGLPEAVLVFEEAGRVLLPGPLIATHLAAGTVPGAAEGETVVAAADGGGLLEWRDAADVVLGEGEGWPPGPGDGEGPHGPGEPDGPPGPGEAGGPSGVGKAGGPSGAGEGEGPSGPGEAVVPPGPGEADVPPGPGEAEGRDGPGEPEGSGPRSGEAVALRSVDPLTPLHRVRARGAPDPVAVLLTAAEQLGTATRACELAVEHARTREQFGRPIGAFQAVQHLCADLLARVETARAALYAAAVTADPADIAAARLLADEAAVRGARDCLQVHGGMGFTWEADVHLLLKRAWVRARRAGGGSDAEELLARELLSGAGR